LIKFINISLESCENVGLRKKGKYCNESEAWVLQKGEKVFCENNFECESNLCSDNSCVDSGFFSMILQWFKDLFS
jgi:hypothetical protein